MGAGDLPAFSEGLVPVSCGGSLPAGRLEVPEPSSPLSGGGLGIGRDTAVCF